MTYVDKKLLKASKDRNTIKLEEDESFTGTYLGYETKVDTRYGKLRYRFKFVMEDGTTKELVTTAKKFLEKMAYVLKNSILEVTKVGEGTDTNYKVKIIKAPKSAPVGDGEEVETVEEPGEEEQETSQVEPDDAEESDDVDISEVPF